MTHEDQRKFRELLAMIASTYEFEFKPEQIKLWWNLFKPYQIDVFENAVYQHIQDPDQGMFAPKPANIMKFIKGTEKQNQNLLEDKALLAWQCVEENIRKIGSWGSPKIDDGLALAAIKSMGGWVHICSLTEDKLTWAQKEFIASYKSYSNTPVEQLPENLPGRVLIENAKKKEQGQGLKTITDSVERYKQITKQGD